MILIHQLHAYNEFMYNKPSLRINTALWSYPDNPVTSDKGCNAGSLTDPGTYGFFYPSNLGHIDFNIFKNPSKTDLLKFQVPQSIEGNFAQINPRCNQTCITILGSDKDSEIHINELIEEEDLLLQVLWVSNLPEVVNDLYQRNQPFIILYWSPSDIINGNISFTSLRPPRNKHPHFEASTIAKYFYYHDMGNQLSENTFKLATKALRSLRIPEETFTQIFQNNENLTEFVMYCNLAKTIVQNMKGDLVTYLPERNVTLSIGGIYPNDGTKITKVFMLASIVTNEEVMSPGYSIEIQERNGGCQADQVLRNVIEYFNVGKIFGILGPACSETIQPIAGISRYLNIPIISYAAEAPDFDQDMYPYFFRTVGSNRQYEDVFIQFFRNFNWKRFATITEEGQKSTEYIVNMEKKFKKDNIESIADIKVTKQMNSSDIHNVSNNYLVVSFLICLFFCRISKI